MMELQQAIELAPRIVAAAVLIVFGIGTLYRIFKTGATCGAIVLTSIAFGVGLVAVLVLMGVV